MHFEEVPDPKKKANMLWKRFAEIITGPPYEQVYLRRIIARYNF